ncbi:MAG: S46 family peptidase [Bacteroidales bacterium]|nr:S46 family peptidase [Bacteroidales bacterium]
MKKILVFALAILAMVGNVRADEGMWLPMFVERLNYVDMQKMGLQLTPEELYSINNSSLKDAIVGLGSEAKPRGFFCTGEIVSEHGLLFTNHHCGYSAVQKLSSVEYDYLKDGFWAKNYGEELPAPEMTASFLIRMEDVTNEVLGVVTSDMDWDARERAIKSKIRKLETAASEDGKYNPVIKGFFEGNEYYMFVYQVYTDVRLVGVANSSIGKFGGDTDNWMWPRHTGDFSIFRVYADKDGNPAEYSKNNVPLTPKHHLPISLDGVKQNDFTMIWGFPGSTERYMSSYGIDYNVDTFYPIIIDIFGKQLEVMDEFMQQDDAINLMYADNHAGLANTWKNFIGQCKMLRKNKVSEAKVELEKDFMKWVNAKADRKAEYGNALENLKSGYETMAAVAKPLFYPNFMMQVGPVSRTSIFEDYYDAVEKDDDAAKEKALAEMKSMDVDALFAETNQQVEKKTFAEMLKLYRNAFDEEELPEFYHKIIDKKFDGNIDAFADYVYENSIYATPENIKAFINKPKVKKIENDYVYIINNQMMSVLMGSALLYRMTNETIAENDHIFVKGLREYYAETQPGKSLYPDANSTMRMSYGSVQDYMPADAVHYDYICTANGILEKYIPGDYEFDAPKRLIELIEKKDFGAYADENGELVVCFLSTNDITGGNSGSPIMNGKGELIGLAFDGNWEAMSGDVNFEPKLQRTINVDIRYVLFVIDKYAGATNLINELDIRKSEPMPVREEVEVSEESEVKQIKPAKPAKPTKSSKVKAKSKK